MSVSVSIHTITKEDLMRTAIDNLNAAMKRAAAIRPKVGGFPYLAESASTGRGHS